MSAVEQEKFSQYLVCPSRHCFGVREGSEAAERFAGRSGLSFEECPECNGEMRKIELRRESEQCECNFGADAPLCKDGCVYLKERNAIPDEPVGLVFLSVDDAQAELRLEEEKLDRRVTSGLTAHPDTLKDLEQRTSLHEEYEDWDEWSP